MAAVVLLFLAMLHLSANPLNSIETLTLLRVRVLLWQQLMLKKNQKQRREAWNHKEKRQVSV